MSRVASFAARNVAPVASTASVPSAARAASSSPRNSASPAATNVTARRPRDATALFLASSSPRANPSPPRCDESSMVKPVSSRSGRWGCAVRGYRRVARSVVRSRGVRGRSSSGHSSRRSRRHRTISGARRKRETQTRDARSRRRRVGTGGSFTHPKAPRPRASAATGAAPCRLASRPSGHCRRETVAFKQATGDLISHSRSGAVAHSRSRPEGLLFASPLLGGATQQPLAAVRGRDASPLERRGGGV